MKIRNTQPLADEVSIGDLPPGTVARTAETGRVFLVLQRYPQDNYVKRHEGTGPSVFVHVVDLETNQFQPVPNHAAVIPFEAELVLGGPLRAEPENAETPGP